MLPVNQLKELSLNYAELNKKESELKAYQNDLTKQQCIAKNIINEINLFEGRIMKAVKQGKLRTEIFCDYLVTKDYAEIITNALRAILAQGITITVINGNYKEEFPKMGNLPTHPVQIKEFLYSITADWSNIKPTDNPNIPDYEAILAKLNTKIEKLSTLCKEAESIINS